jgi:uncharacterized membrane protein YeaQ/YmgE (transglycosylase-associated protein family)
MLPKDITLRKEGAMAFEILVWVFFGAFLGLLTLWFTKFRYHWFETLLWGVTGAFAGGFLSHLLLPDGPRLGTLPVAGLVAAPAGAAVALGIYWVFRHRRHGIGHHR